MNLHEAWHMPSSPKPVPPIETIRNAAILYKGEKFEGTTHGHALGALLKYLKRAEPDLYNKIGGDEYQLVDELEKNHKGSYDFEGFITTRGRDVTSKEATEGAREARQLRKNKDAGSELFSE